MFDAEMRSLKKLEVLLCLEVLSFLILQSIHKSWDTDKYV